MANGGSPVKVQCESKDSPDQENAPDFDEDTLRGKLGSTSASAIVRTISIPQVSRCKQTPGVEKDNVHYDHFKLYFGQS